MAFQFSLRIPFRKLWIAAIPASLLCTGLLNACADNSYIFLGAALSAFFLSIWATQYSIAAGELPFKWYEYPLTLLYDFSSLLIICAIVALFMPAYQCHTDRTKVSEALSYASAFKAEVAEALAMEKPIKPRTEESFPASVNIAFLDIDKEGKILLMTREPHASIFLIPERQRAGIHWTCHGRPARFVPANCR